MKLGYLPVAEHPGQYFGQVIEIAIAQAAAGQIDYRDFHSKARPNICRFIWGLLILSLFPDNGIVFVKSQIYIS